MIVDLRNLVFVGATVHFLVCPMPCAPSTVSHASSKQLVDAWDSVASMYFDDLTVQDLGSVKGSAQQLITSWPLRFTFSANAEPVQFP